MSRQNRWFVLSGLATALIIAVFLSPFASSDPDGLDRVAEDHNFNTKADPEAPASQLPTAQVFDEYALKGVPEGMATPLAGLLGTVITFGVAWGLGKLAVRGSHPPEPPSQSPE